MKKPVIGYDVRNDRWYVRDNGKAEVLTTGELCEKYGIWNPIIYCQQQKKEHAKPAGDVK